MIIKTKHNDYFMNLINNLDPKCIESFFKSEVVDEISNQKLKEITNNLKYAEYKYNLMEKVLPIVISINNEEITKKMALKMEQIRKSLNKYENRLDIFESNLAYLLITETLTLQTTKILGFDEEYIKNLLTKYNNKLQTCSEEYYYNEESGLTSKVNKNGSMMILPYTPNVVVDALKNNNKPKHLIKKVTK